MLAATCVPNDDKISHLLESLGVQCDMKELLTAIRVTRCGDTAPKRLIYIHGPLGSGKTFLAGCIKKAVGSEHVIEPCTSQYKMSVVDGKKVFEPVGEPFPSHEELKSMLTIRDGLIVTIADLAPSPQFLAEFADDTVVVNTRFTYE